MTKLEQAAPSVPLAKGPFSPAARAVNLTKTYGKGDAAVRAVDDVNVEFERGRFTAVMGPSGSGKSTLMHCLAGLDAPSSGRAFVGGTELGHLDDAALTQMRRDRVGFVFQSFNLVPTLTARENITLPADLAGAKVDQGWFDFLVSELGIGNRISHRPNEMSGGQQQRVACARALINRPDLIFADEPTGNLDFEVSSGNAGVPTALGDRARAVDRHGHPRSPRRFVCRPCRFPDRREGRRRARLPHRRHRGGPNDEAGQLICGTSWSRA